VKGARSFLLILLPFFIFTCLSFVIFQKSCDSVMSVHAEKLLPFNHKSHLTKHGAHSCEVCHGYYGNGRFKGIPTVGDCKMCHDGSTTKVQAFFEGFRDSDQPWGSSVRQPDLVYFSHMAVTKNTMNVPCESCHGGKKFSTKPTGTGMKMSMGTCEDCHDATGVSNKCAVCHD